MINYILIIVGSKRVRGNKDVDKEFGEIRETMFTKSLLLLV